MCNESCKCSDCKNFEGSVDRASVLGLHPQLTSPPSAKRAKPSEPSHGGAAYAVRESGPASAPAEPPSAQAEAALDTPLVRARDAIARLYISRSVCSYLVLVLALWGIWGSGRSDQSFCPNADIFFASLSPFFRQ